jgi:hypothetical protein
VPGEYCTSKGICVFISIATIASSSAIRIFFDESSFENACEVNKVFNSLHMLLLLLHLDKGHPSLHYILCKGQVEGNRLFVIYPYGHGF